MYVLVICSSNILDSCQGLKRPGICVLMLICLCVVVFRCCFIWTFEHWPYIIVVIVVIVVVAIVVITIISSSSSSRQQ